MEEGFSGLIAMDVEADGADFDSVGFAGITRTPPATSRVPSPAASRVPSPAALWDPWGLFFIHLTHESGISDYKGMNSGWMNLG